LYTNIFFLSQQQRKANILNKGHKRCQNNTIKVPIQGTKACLYYKKNSEGKKKCKTLPVQVELNQIQTAPKHSSRVKIQNLKLCSKAKHLTRTTARREETTSLR
jgi:protease II